MEKKCFEHFHESDHREKTFINVKLIETHRNYYMIESHFLF